MPLWTRQEVEDMIGGLISQEIRSELSDDDFNYQDWNTSFLSQTSHDSLGQQNELLKSFWLKWPDNKVVKKMINNISFIL